MYLIDTKTLKLVEFIYNNPPPYAILSHTWSEKPEDEVLFKDMMAGTASDKPAYVKLKHTADRARGEGFQYCWIDTSCIDKGSSAELQEAINSMFSWYENAAVCYVYLSDVKDRHSYDDEESLLQAFRDARWFRRGWTLQELIAPLRLIFYSQDWTSIGTRSELLTEIANITGINGLFLKEGVKFSKKMLESRVSVAERMSWAADRKTSRPEDMAYCLMGLFSVNMPMLYGEGDKAFLRLQEEILKRTTDYSIFAWTDPSLGPETPHGLLADKPAQFAQSRGVKYDGKHEFGQLPVSMTGRGLRVEAQLYKPFERKIEIYILALPGTLVVSKDHGCIGDEANKESMVVGILLRRLRGHASLFIRASVVYLLGFAKWHYPLSERTIYIPQHNTAGLPFWPLALPSTQTNQELGVNWVKPDRFAFHLVRPICMFKGIHQSCWNNLGWTALWENSDETPFDQDRYIKVQNRNSLETFNIRLWIPGGKSKGSFRKDSQLSDLTEQESSKAVSFRLQDWKSGDAMSLETSEDDEHNWMLQRGVQYIGNYKVSVYSSLTESDGDMLLFIFILKSHET